MRRKQRGLALPATLFMMLILLSVSSILTMLSQQGLRRISSEQGTLNTTFAAEGSLHKQISDLGVYSNLWDQQAPLTTKPNGYTQYSPASYTATNGVPVCASGASCHRNYYPAGGGIIKNVGPLTSVGATVDSSFPITDQLNYTTPQTEDVTLASVKGWSQVERLDTSRPGANTVGGSLSSSLAEGGNAKVVRFRLTATSLRKMLNQNGLATVVAVVELPVM